MTEKTGSPSFRDGAYGIELRQEEEASVVVLFRRGTGADIGRRDDVWWCTFGTVAQARQAHSALLRLPDRWAAWAMLAPIVGPEHLLSVILADVGRPGRRDRSSKRAAGRIGRAASPPTILDDGGVLGGTRPAVTLDLIVTEDGGARIVAYHGEAAFLSMRFDQPVQARRVWDWARWQRHAFGSWHALFLRDGPDAVERLVIDGMSMRERDPGLETSRDPRRPLMRWRPGAV